MGCASSNDSHDRLVRFVERSRRTMTKEILMVADAVSAEKGVDREIIFEAIELALSTATKKRYEEESDIEVIIDRESGDYETFRLWTVMPDDHLAILGTELTTEEAEEVDPALKIGDVHKEQVSENVEFFSPNDASELADIILKYNDSKPKMKYSNYKSNILDFGKQFYKLIEL